jgi:hypothetical protein
LMTAIIKIIHFPWYSPSDHTTVWEKCTQQSGMVAFVCCGWRYIKQYHTLRLYDYLWFHICSAVGMHQALITHQADMALCNAPPLHMQFS